MTRSYLVCYDVCDPKRLRKVHKVLGGYGKPWQLSVFWCVLSKIERVRLQSALEAVMNQKDDQIIIVDMGGDEDSARDAVCTLGQATPTRECGIVVV
jgi:CRISPR-associated protein Cas2